MPKMYFPTSGCAGATSGATGREYNTDRQGFIHVSDSTDVACLKSGGYIVAGGMPRLDTYWVCEGCGWEAAIRHCPKCDREDLAKVVR